jgi:membrane fusion protein (multidrug efflux system)
VRPVTLGDTSGENFIVKKGLKAGETVIVNNFFRVRPGAAVAIDKTINAEGK